MALFSAAAKGDVLKIQSLIGSEDKSEDSGGVDVNCSDASGKTALHFASENGHLQTVKCLTHLGAKVNVVDAYLQTSVHLCSKKGHLHVVELLVNQGADIDVGDKDGFTALHVASFKGHLDIVKYLVSKGAQLDKCDKNDRTPLYCASQEGHLEVVEFIVNKGAGIEIGDKDGFTALHIASFKGHVDIVKYFVRKGAQLEKCDKNGRTPLYCASQKGHLEIVEYIVNNGAGIEIGDKGGFTALHLASFKGHLDIVKYLVGKGAQLDKCDKTDRTPLSCASTEGHLEVVEYIVNKGAGIDIGDKEEVKALHIAAFKGHLDIVKYLVSKGADPGRLANDYWTPLHFALDGGHLDIAEYLLTEGANINACGIGGCTALHTASQTGNIDVVKYLTSQGAELDKSTDDGWTELSLASFGGHLDIAKALVNEGVDVDKALKSGTTPLCLATKGGHLDIVEVLLNVGANIDNCKLDGLTALHIASLESHLDIFKYLVRKGAKLDICDKNHRTPLSCASQEGYREVVEYIVNKGAGIEIGDKDGITALHIASFKGHLDIVTYLVGKGAQLDKTDKNDRTPLYRASQEGHLEVVEYIVNNRADIEIADKDGFTALHIASLKGHFDIVKYLVSKGADLWRLADDYWTPSRLALNGGHLDIHDFLLNREATKIVKPFIGFEEDQYDYLRSTFGSKALPSFMPHPYSQPYDPYLTSPRDSSSSPTEIIKEETKSISLDEYSIKVPLSPDDVERAKYITAEALTSIPPDLNLEKDEVIISVGLKLSPPGLQFQTPVEVKVLHSAIFTNPDKAEIVLYTRRTGFDDFSRIVPASDKGTRCVVAKNHLTLYLDHFSEWWIISLIRRYFIGKRLICTPYVPLSTSTDVMNYILLNIKDDFCDMKEDTIRDYKVAFPGEQYCVYWGKGPLFVRHLENKEEVSKEELEECAFFDMTTHRMPFNLQSREQIVSRVLVTLILKQKITKKITFPVQYNDVPHANPSAQSTPTGTASSKGKAKPSDVGRGTSKSSQLSEELTRSEHHLETIGTTSPEPAYTKDGSHSPTEVITRPRPLTPPSIESPSCEHAYQVTHDLVTETETVDERGRTEVLTRPSPLISSAEPPSREHAYRVTNDFVTETVVPPACAANIAQKLVSGLSADQMHQRSGDVYNIMVINNPKGDNSEGNSVAPAPVPISSIVPPKLQHELRCRLNRESPVFGDWRGLANELGLGDYIQSLEQCKNPTEELLVLAEIQKKIQNLGDLAKAFEHMNRGDCQELCENYAFKRTKSADPRKDQMEDDDTDTSD